MGSIVEIIDAVNSAHSRRQCGRSAAFLMACVLTLTLGSGLGLPASYAEDATDGLYGVIELGSAGIRAQICQEPVLASGTNTIRTVFGFDPRDVKPSEPTAVANCIRVVRELVGTMIRVHGVPTEHIYLVGSSGLAEAPTGSRLRDEVANTLGRTLTYVTVKDEARFTFKGLVPPGDLTEVALIDVGGGNSKAVFFKSIDGKGFVDTVRLCDGVRALSKRADPTKPEAQYRQELLAIKEHEIVPAINQIVIDNPAFATRPILYLSGGISWVMASSLAPPDTKLGAGNDKVELKAEDIARWLKKAQAAPRFAQMSIPQKK